MEQHVALVTANPVTVRDRPTVWASPSMLSWLGLHDGETCALRFGLASEPTVWQEDERLDSGELSVNRPLSEALCLQTPLSVTLFRPAPEQVGLGPLVGLLISSLKMEAVLNGKPDHVYCRYALAARDAGAVLLFFAAEGLDLARRCIDGYVHHCAHIGACRWTPLHAPLPRVIYDRSFGKPGRAAAAELRQRVAGLGTTVVNNPVKITKLQTFQALQPPGELAPHLPLTAPLTPESLQHLVDRYDDLYLKPDCLYKGKGVCRLKRHGLGWELQTRGESGNESRWVERKEDLPEILAELLHPDVQYVVQEGLPLAAYLGNRFDLRSMVQRDGSGNWQVSGVVARIAPEGSAITSPRSGGQIAEIDMALQHAFGESAGRVRAEIDRVSLALAERMDQRLGPCAELGLDLGILQDGTVKLIEANGIPLRVSLQRLRDPLVTERIDRLPVHFAAYLDTQG